MKLTKLWNPEIGGCLESIDKGKLKLLLVIHGEMVSEKCSVVQEEQKVHKTIKYWRSTYMLINIGMEIRQFLI